MNPQTRGRVVLLAIFLLFLAPVVLAFALYFGLGFGAAATNHGILVDPARPVPTMQWHRHDGRVSDARQVLAGQWTMLVLARHGCGARCRSALATSAHIRSLLHDDVTRVQRVLLLGVDRPAHGSLAPDLRVYRGAVGAPEAFFNKTGADKPGTIYLVDPHGNWMMYYPPSEQGNGLFKDLKQLLRLSNIG